MAVSANSEIIRSGAGNIPWMMTELQGGNNTYSGYAAMCPTKEEISQWLWTVIGSGSKGAIFWCLNPRSSGNEAGESYITIIINKSGDKRTVVLNIKEDLHLNSSILFADKHGQISGNTVEIAPEETMIIHWR